MKVSFRHNKLFSTVII
uniref:Uncharacterized protein n=1 Tax=Arundo donax TaxID=35708 RepID=A0A0A8ZA35_ARUDO